MQPPIPKNRTVKIIFILGLTSIFLCICAVVTVLMISRSFFDTDPTIAAFMEAGIQNDLETVHPMLSSQHFMTDQTIEALF